MLNNGVADYQRGHMVVAAAMGISEYMKFAVDGPFGLRNMLENNIDCDGQYYETSSGYAEHVRINSYMNICEILGTICATPIIPMDTASPPQVPRPPTCSHSDRLHSFPANLLMTLGDDAPNVACSPTRK